MDSQYKDILNEALADAVMDRPREFFIGPRRFCLWSPTLGMSLMLERNITALGLDYEVIRHNPYIEALRIASTKRNDVCYILAIHSFRKFDDLANSKNLRRRAKIFASKLSDEELAKLIMYVLSEPKAESLISLSQVATEQTEQSKIANFKNKDGHTKTFGGKTIFGTLIDTACAKYGWTKEYVVWGIDLISLRMMLADSVNSIYLSDDEMKSLGISSTHNQKFGMSPEDIAKLKAMDWS